MAKKKFTFLWMACGVASGLSLALAAEHSNWVTLDGSRWISRAAVLFALLLLIVPRAWRYLRRCEQP